MRDDPHGETALAQLGHREADAVDRHRAFRHETGHQRRRCIDVEQPVVALLFPLTNLADGIDVAGDEVAPHPLAKCQRPLKIDRRAATQRAKVGYVPRLSQQVELKAARLAAFRHLDGGEAAAVHGDAVAGVRAAEANVRRDRQRHGVGAVFDGFDPACFLDESGEHFQGCASATRAVSIRSGPRFLQRIFSSRSPLANGSPSPATAVRASRPPSIFGA